VEQQATHPVVMTNLKMTRRNLFADLYGKRQFHAAQISIKLGSPVQSQVRKPEDQRRILVGLVGLAVPETLLGNNTQQFDAVKYVYFSVKYRYVTLFKLHYPTEFAQD
jgi:hypothetical protein